jgi:hypothetical protein
MANISNVSVKSGNVLSLSGSSVEITGSQIRTTGDLFVNGTVSASVLHISETIVSSSTIYHSGSTIFGDTGSGAFMDTHQFTGSVNISGTVHSITGALNIVGNVSGTTFTGSFSGDGSGLTGINLSGSAVTSITAGTNLSASASTGAVTVALTSSITSGLTTLTGVTNIGATTGSFSVLSASAAEFNGSVVIYGTASLTAVPDAAYVRYEASSGSVVDKIVVFPGIYTVGGVTGSVFSGSGAGITGLTASNFSSFTSDVRNQISATGSVNYNPATGVISSSALTTAVTQIESGSNITVTNGSGPTATVALSSSVTGLTNLSSSAITGSNILASNSFKAAGSFTVAQITTTGSYVVNGLDQVVFANATSAPLTVTVPTIAAGNAGRQLVIKKIDTTVNTVTISGSIDGALFYELNGPYQSVTLVSDGSTYWFVV